jgi:hypothetical protein
LISIENVGSRLFVASAVLIAYGMVIIFAGHGMGPVALLLIFGYPGAWLSGQILGWLGVLASLAALWAKSDSSYQSMRFCGALLLVLSIAVFLSRSEAIAISALTAIPLLVLWLFLLWRFVDAIRTSASAAAPGRPRQILWAVVGLGISLAVDVTFLVPAFVRHSMAPEEIIAVLQFVALSLFTVQTWRGRNWARWGVVVLLIAPKIYYAPIWLETFRHFSFDAMLTGILFLLDFAILVLLFSRSASLWLAGRHVHTVHET